MTQAISSDCEGDCLRQEAAEEQERPFAFQLDVLDFGDVRLHVWYTRVLGTRDIDVLILCEKRGFFVIELKSINLGAIAKIDADNGIHLKDGVKKSTSKSPWLQALEAAESLESRFNSSAHYKDTLGRMWISSSAALFAISRTAFIAEYGGNPETQHACHQLALGMIFSEDLESGAKLIERLDYIKEHPLYKARPKFNRRQDFNSETAELLDKFARWSLEPAETLTASEQKRVDTIQKVEERRLDEVTDSDPIFCSGFAGTGKTVLGLQYAIRRQVPSLFLCFNKVLGTDVRRLTSMADLFADFPLDCCDLAQLLQDCERRLALSPVSFNPDFEDANSFERRRVERIIHDDSSRAAGRLKQIWRLIVVDEAQDLSGNAWKLLDYLSGTEVQLFVISSKRQMLYRDALDAYITDVIEPSTPEQNRLPKRRVYRTTSETFIIGQLFAQKFPNVEKAIDLWTSSLKKQYQKALAKEDQSHLPFEFSRTKGHTPDMRPVRLMDTSASIRAVALSISKALFRIEEGDGTPSDLLILLPFVKKERTKWSAILAAALRDEGVDFCDYVNTETRRVAHAPNQVRIVTYHSARGIESLHSIVLGFEFLVDAARADNTRASNLGYIALTRSAYDTEVFYDEAANAAPQILFLNQLLLSTGL